MTMNYIIADALTRIRNAQMRKKPHTILPYSKLIKNSLNVLLNEGYIRDFQEVEDDSGKLALKVDLKYREGEPAITNIELISRPGCRVYSSINNLTKVINGLGISVLSTSKGVMSDDQARVEHIGGELLFKVY
jgi:small subunit ribosomal protein S8